MTMHGTERTDPYWVQMKDAHGTWHRHALFGREVTRTREVTDASGHPVFEPVTETTTLGDALSGARWAVLPPAAYRRAKALRSRGAALTDPFTYETGKQRPVVEKVVIGRYANQCTEGVPYSREWRAVDDPTLYLPCVPHPHREQQRKMFARYQGEGDYGREGRNVQRSRTRQVTKLANAGSGVE